MSIVTIKSNSFKTGFVYDRRQEFLLDSVADFDLLPKDCAPGSMAYLADNSVVRRLSSSGAWMDVEEGASKEDIDRLSEEIARKDKPLVYIDGNIPTTKDNVLAEMRVVSSWLNFHAYIKIKCQGSSSMNYDKKNFTVTLYQDEARTIPMNILIPGWKIATNKFVFKANYIDHLHFRNLGAGLVYSDVVASRPDYDTLPVELRNSPNNGAVIGFPIIVYTNGSYQGLYTWNIGKDPIMWGMDGSNPEHILLCAETNTNDTYAETPCNFRALWSGVNEEHWSVEVGENSAAVKDALNTLISCVKDTADEEFVQKIGEHIDILSVIDVWWFQYVFCGIDGLGKNLPLAKYTSKKWYDGVYDLDSTLGLWVYGTYFLPANTACPQGYQEKYNLLYERVISLFADEALERYVQLRKGPLSYANIVSKFENAVQQIGEKAYVDDLVVYPDIPSAEENNIWQIRNFVRDRLEYCDSMIIGGVVEMVEYIESDGASWIDTGVAPDNDMLIDITYLNPEYDVANENIFGAHVDDMIYRCTGGVGGHYVTWRIGGTDYTTSIAADGRMPNGSKRSLTFDTSVSDVFTPKSTIHVFTALHNANDAWVPGTFKLYGFKITKKSTSEVLLDLLPAVDGAGVAGMYDDVSKRMFYNGGTGAFTVPAN